MLSLAPVPIPQNLEIERRPPLIRMVDASNIAGERPEFVRAGAYFLPLPTDDALVRAYFHLELQAATPTAELGKPATGALSFERVCGLGVVDQLEFLRAVLSVNKSQLAQVLGVSRPTLYGWLEGGNAHDAHAVRIRAVAQVLFDAGVRPQRPLNALLVRVGTGGTEPAPLLQLLREGELDVGAIRQAVQQVMESDEQSRELRKARELELQKAGFEPVGEAQGERALLMDELVRRGAGNGED